MMNAFIVLQTNTLVGGERMSFALVMNVLMLETNALNVRVEASAPHSYTCSYSVPVIFKQSFSRKCYSQELTFESWR